LGIGKSIGAQWLAVRPPFLGPPVNSGAAHAAKFIFTIVELAAITLGASRLLYSSFQFPTLKPDTAHATKPVPLGVLRFAEGANHEDNLL
jgi:hypothetical protein